MKHILSNIFLLLLIVAQPCFGQKAKKPQLLVYGSDLLAFSAAVQSAKSSVPTIWLLPEGEIMSEFSEERVSMETLPRIDGGIWMEILMEMALSKSPNDSLAIAVKNDMSPRLFKNAIEKILRKLPNLTVIKGEQIISVKRRKRDWEVQLSSKHTYQIRSVVDASPDQGLAALAGISWEPTVKPISGLTALSPEDVRTLLAVGAIDRTLYGVRLADVLLGEQDGFFNFRSVDALLQGDIDRSPFRAAIGQAVGATAAYLTFFKTSSDKIDVRKIQTELMGYGARILPFQDISIDDKYYGALQQFGLAGVLEGLHREEAFFFHKDKQVSFEEIEPIFDRLYTRSQLWFLDNKGDYFRWKDFLSLIKFVGLRGDNIDQQIEKEWSERLGFEGKFDAEALVNRYQFAVVLARYANPYIKAVNQQGVFIN